MVYGTWQYNYTDELRTHPLYSQGKTLQSFQTAPANTTYPNDQENQIVRVGN